MHKTRSRLAVAALACCLLAVLLSGAGASPLDEFAHRVLTDGSVALDDPSDSRWLELVRDAPSLPVTYYTPGQFAFWGLNYPHNFSPWRTPRQWEYVLDANIRGVRFDLMWQGIQQQGPDVFNYDWYLIDHDLNIFAQNGFSVQMLLTATPAWANGLRPRYFPPTVDLENELLDLSSGSATLAMSPVIATEPDWLPLLVTAETQTKERVEDEILSNDLKPGQVVRTSQRPLIPGSESVWLDENDGRGWVKWTRVTDLINSQIDAEHYQIDRSGRLRFHHDDLFYDHGKTPASGSRVKISYDVLTGPFYRLNTDYTLDHITGTVRRLDGAYEGRIASETFDGPELDARWQWMNAPPSWDVSVTRPGHLRYAIDAPAAGAGHFLHQSLNGSGDLTLMLRLSRAATSGNSQTGIMVYNDSQNWFRFALSTNAGRPLLTRCSNGAISTYGLGGEIGFAVTAPRWLTVRKIGNNFTVYTSNADATEPDGAYQNSYTFQFQLSASPKVGISSTGSDPAGPEADSFRVMLPSIPADGRVRVHYNPVNYAPWKRFVRETVQRYKDTVKFWEIINEPDQGWTWRGGQDLFALYMKEAAEVIREVSPDALVVSGGYANGATRNLDTVYKTVPASTFDLTAWHPYLFSNKPPDAVNWLNSSTNTTGRQIMAANGDAAKGTFLGEMAATSGVLASGGGMNERKQAEYGLRMLMLSRKPGWVKGVQWWPGLDMSPQGVSEDGQFGAHDGLFYSDLGDPKPAYWAYRNASNNKGILIDLASYDAAGNVVPPGGLHEVRKVSVYVGNQADLAGARVFASRTATDDSSRPASVVARHLGQAQTPPVVVAVNSASPAMTTETWEAVALTPLTFSVTGSASGVQGLAVVGEQFTSVNGTVSFTIPAVPKPYVAGDRFVFETFAGDGFALVGSWHNSGQSGSGYIDIPVNALARYVRLELTHASAGSSSRIAEVAVENASGANVALGKAYLVAGYERDAFAPGPAQMPPADALRAPDGTVVRVRSVVLHLRWENVGFIQTIDRSLGLRVVGKMSAGADELVSLVGTVETSEDGSRYIALRALWSLGKALARPLVVSERSLGSRLIDNLGVQAYGFVVPGSITASSYEISDGYSVDGLLKPLLVLTELPPEVIEGEFVAVRGAAGWQGARRVIYQVTPPPPEEP